MTVITIPSIDAETLHPKLMRKDVELEYMGGDTSIVAPPYARFAMRIPLARQPLSTAEAWFAALAQLSKLSNTFKLTPPGYNGPSSGYAGADPVVDGAGQLGLSLTARSATPSTLIVKKGNYIEVNTEFKIVTADATSDVSGNVTINFEPALRSSPADGATIYLQTPRLTMRLMKPVAEWDTDSDDLHRIVLNAIEAYWCCAI